MRKTVKTSDVLTILICTTPKRVEKFLPETLNALNKNGIRLIYLGDNFMTVGEKRNHLMSMVKTPYMTFFDDDDEPHERYTDIVLDYIEKYPEVECFSITCYKTSCGTGYREFDYDYKWTRNFHGFKDKKKVLHMVPNHICIWKTDTARRVQFPHKSLSEDHMWAEHQRRLGYSHLKMEIEEMLYHYKFCRDTTETRLR